MKAHHVRNAVRAAALEILDAVPDPPITREQRLERRIWHTAAGEDIPLGEMEHRHLMNLLGYVARRRVACERSMYMASPAARERRSALMVIWEGWKHAVLEEIARRRAGLDWMLGWGFSPELNLEVAFLNLETR